MRAAAGKVALDSPHGLATTRYDSFATTFAKHADETEFPIEVAGAQAAELGDAQPRAVEELKHGAVAKAERRVVRMLDQRDRLLARQRMRWCLWRARQRHIAHPSRTRTLTRAVPQQ